MAVVDQIIDESAQSGVMVSLVEQAITDGAQVILLGYYATPQGSEFEGCDEERAAINQRYSALAAARAAVHFVDMGSVMSPQSTPGHYADDLIHPSVAGSQAIGEAVAAQISALQ